MTYEMVYQRLCVIRDKNYADPADFANDVLSLMASFERKQAAEQSMHADAACACPDDGNLQINSDFVCAVCHKTPRR